MTESTSSPRHAVGDPPGTPRASNGAGSAALVLGAVALLGAFFRVVDVGSVLLGTVLLAIDADGTWTISTR